MRKRFRGAAYGAALLACVLTLSLLPETARADTVTVGSDAALREEIADGETSIALGASFTTSTPLTVPAGTTVYVNGEIWRISAAVTVSGAVNTSAAGSLVACDRAGDFPALMNVLYARTLSLEGVSGDTRVASMTVDGVEVQPYQIGDISAGGVTVYLDAAIYDRDVSAVTTDTGAVYRLSNGNLSRVYSITYYDVDGRTVLAGLSPVSYTASDAAFALPTPQIQGRAFTGWTSAAVTTPQASVTIPHGTTGDLSFIANWRQGSHSGGWGGGSAALSANDTEETETAAPATEEMTQTPGTGRRQKASSKTTVHFTDGTNAAVLPALATSVQPAETGTPIWIYIVCGAALAAGIAWLCIRSARRRNAEAAQQGK